MGWKRCTRCIINFSLTAMKILMICDFYGIGQQYQENMVAKYYALLGHEVHIIASTFDNVFNYVNDNYTKVDIPFIEHDGYATIYRTPYRLKIKNLFKMFVNIKQRVEDLAPELVYFHNLSLNIHQVIPYIKKNRKARMIMDFHIDYSNIGQSWKSRRILHGFIRKGILQRYASYFKLFYPIVPNGITFLNEVYGIPIARMKLLPLGYDELNADKVRDTVDRTGVRVQLGIDEEDFLIITGGKFTEEKRTELLLEACNMLNDDNIHVVVFGSASTNEQAYADKLKAIARKNVHFLGWLDGEQILTYMHTADLAVYPSSQSVLWQQSIGMYLPMILGDNGNQDPSYLNLHDNIIVLQGEDITAPNIAHWIQRIKSDKVLRERMRDGAEKTANEYLRYTAICQTTLNDAFMD